LRSRSRTLSATLLPGTRLFDRVWYGRREATAEEFESLIRLHDALPTSAAAVPAGPDSVADQEVLQP